MDKSKIYLDLSKCTEEEINRLGLEDSDFLEFSDVELFRLQNPEYMILSFNYGKLNISHKDWFLLKDKTELTYPEFIKLFEGGEEENEIENIKDIAHTEGVLIGLKICKEMWAQGTISHENIQQEIHYYQEELDNIKSNN